MKILLASPTETILGEIADQTLKREDIAQTYAWCLAKPAEPPDFPKINRAIVERWSLSGLRWIKTRAWKIVEGRIGVK